MDTALAPSSARATIGDGAGEHAETNTAKITIANTNSPYLRRICTLPT
jgi:hypothetical protein